MPGRPPAEAGTPAVSPDREAALARHWRRTRRLTVWLLALWFGATFCVIVFARALAQVTIVDWPLSYYLAAQGMPVFYVLLVGVYAWCMRRIDRDAEDDTAPAKEAQRGKERHAP